MANRMEKTKTTVVIDKGLLEQFKRLALLRYGTARSLSLELEKAIRAFTPPEILSLVAKRLNLSIDSYPSLDEIERTRVRVTASAGTVVRKMRDEREKRLLGHKRHRKEVR